MIICKHRVNSSESLTSTPVELGVEVDLRSDGKNIYISHDAFELGENFESWIKNFHHRFLIANVKEEGLETKVRNILERRNIQHWAFLDQSLPFFVKELGKGFSNTMIRMSEYENLESAKLLPKKPDWVWLDSFTGNYPDPQEIMKIKELGYKFMIVSPELQGRPAEMEINIIKQIFDLANVDIDGVCTKFPQMWQ